MDKKKGREGEQSEIYQKRTDGGSRKNSKDGEREREIQIQREIKSAAVKETEVVGWVRE